MKGHLLKGSSSLQLIGGLCAPAFQEFWAGSGKGEVAARLSILPYASVTAYPSGGGSEGEVAVLWKQKVG